MGDTSAAMRTMRRCRGADKKNERAFAATKSSVNGAWPRVLGALGPLPGENEDLRRRNFATWARLTPPDAWVNVCSRTCGRAQRVTIQFETGGASGGGGAAAAEAGQKTGQTVRRRRSWIEDHSWPGEEPQSGDRSILRPDWRAIT
jgi:hypothetical protein